MDDQKARERATIFGIVKAMGALFILSSVAVWFDLGGISTMIGLNDGFTNKILAGALLAIGIGDFLIVPKLLERTLNRK